MLKYKFLKEKQYSLVAHWLYNAKIGKKNDCILYISSSRPNLRENFKVCLRGNIVVCKLLSNNEDIKIPKNSDTRNIVVLGDIFINLESLDSSSDKILFFKISDYSEIKEILSLVDKSEELPSLEHYHSSMFFIEKRDPLEIIYSDKKTISEFLFLVINDDFNFPMYDKLSLLFTNKTSRYSRGLIIKDIELLDQEKMLTSRLGTIIYKLAFLNLRADKSTIGRFYRKHLGSRSKNLNFKSWDIENVKGYSIIEDEEKTVRLEIAQNLLDSNFNVDIIPKLTGLSYNEVFDLKTKKFN